MGGKNFYLIILFVIFIAKNLFSQAEFVITVEGFRWIESKSKNKINIQIDIKIKNVGNEEGVCEDIEELKLYCSNDYKNREIKRIKEGSYIYKKIKPNDYITGFITFEVPKDADDLELRFPEELGGARKYITKSYDKCMWEEINKKTESEKSKGDKYFQDGNYEKAIQCYITCANLDTTRKKEFHNKIIDCYIIIADDCILKYNKYALESYLENYKDNLLKAYVYDTKNIEIKKRLAKYYKIVGEKYLAQNFPNIAISNFETSLQYYDDYELRKKINELKQTEENKKEEISYKKEREQTYQRLKEPTVGYNFRGGFGVHNNTKYSSRNLIFWNLELDLPIKLFTLPPPAPTISFPLNLDVGYQGSIGGSSEIQKFLAIEDYEINLENGPPIGELYFNGGLGIAILTDYFAPIITANYGIYIQYKNFRLSNPYNNSYIENINKKLGEIGVGSGLKVEVGFRIGKSPAFFMGYSYRNYYIKSDVNFLSNRYEAHYINIGLLGF